MAGLQRFIDENRLRISGAEVLRGLTENFDPQAAVVYNDDMPGELASPTRTFLFSGPPLANSVLEQAGGRSMLTPLGLIQDATISAQRALRPVTEFGYKHYRIVPGRFNHSLSIQRLVSYSGNLAGMLYRWALINPDFLASFSPNERQSVQALLAEENNNQSLHVVGLDSDLLDLPFGIYMVDITEDGDFITSTYLERCKIATTTKSIGANNPFIFEALNIMYVRPVPVQNALLNLAQGQGYSMQSGPDTTASGSLGDLLSYDDPSGDFDPSFFEA